MTSEEQLKAERENKDILDNILANDLGNELIEYYKTHTQKETIDRYGLKNTTLLRKALTKLNFDFGYKRKNSPLKGRKSTRSHASYVSGGTKSSSTQRLNWMNKSAEEKEAWSKRCLFLI